MALRNSPTPVTTAAQFETEDETSAGESFDTSPAATTPTAQATNEAAAPTPAPSTSTAVATQRSTAVATRTTASAVHSQNVLSTLKDTFVVDFDSLPRILASQGSFMFKDNDEDLGAEIEMQLMSYQDSWVCSPNDTKADVELVKYADNATTSKDGVDLKQHLEMLRREGWSKAAIQQRCIIVGELLKTNGKKESDRVGELVQMDLPDSGRRSFNTYTLQASFKVAKGRISAEDAAHLKIQAVKDKAKSGEIYTKTVFV